MKAIVQEPFGPQGSSSSWTPTHPRSGPTTCWSACTPPPSTPTTGRSCGAIPASPGSWKQWDPPIPSLAWPGSTGRNSDTPHRNAVRVHDLLPNSALLTVDGVGHGALLFSSCAQDATAQYLLTEAVPPPGTVCGQDLAPFDQPPA
ncbi:alpha/beta hydrolase [Modestobacter altitudinis]|uniref:alpha/beta hydrolase n=1 Tax=Modestobacter altitudinis TaxID=2213158 RepID=UPI00110CD929|nr:alpha/beta hydrolase [Modestobacter altitudinis]